MASDQNQSAPQMKKTLSLMGLTINAMALIAPGAFLWLNYQAQAAQVDPSGVSTAPDIWFGLFIALVLSFLTAASYAWLARRYPDAGTGSSYYFAQRALLDRGSSNRRARDAKFIVGWLSHLYYWVYPGVMVAFMGFFMTYILQTVGFPITVLEQIAIVVVFAVVVGFIAYRGIQGSTRTNLIINIVQLAMLIGVTVLALAYRFINPDHVTFYYSNPASVVMPSDMSHVLFQASLAILVLVGFESITALTSEAKNPKDVPRAVVLSLVIQGAFAYLLGFFGIQAWINSKYTFAMAATSSGPLGDIVRISTNALFGGGGFVIMLIVAAAVAAAVLRHNPRMPQHWCKSNLCHQPRYRSPTATGQVKPKISARQQLELGTNVGLSANRSVRSAVSKKLNRSHAPVELWNIPTLRRHLHNSSCCAVQRTSLNPNQIHNPNRWLCRQHDHDGSSRLAGRNRRKRHAMGSIGCNSNNRHMDGYRTCILCRKLKEQLVKHLSRSQDENQKKTRT